jgi:transcriptional regulator with XRE-family HTH domain
MTKKSNDCLNYTFDPQQVAEDTRAPIDSQGELRGCVTSSTCGQFRPGQGRWPAIRRARRCASCGEPAQQHADWALGRARADGAIAGELISGPMLGAEAGELRIQLGLTQPALARALGCSRPFVSNWECCRRGVPSMAAAYLRGLAKGRAVLKEKASKDAPLLPVSTPRTVSDADGGCPLRISPLSSDLGELPGVSLVEGTSVNVVVGAVDCAEGSISLFMQGKESA